MPSDRIREILPPDTAATWDAIAPIVPPDAYLGGGTAIAVHLSHRVSRDLDFFFHHESIDLDKLTRRLTAAGPFAVTERSAGTLNGVFSATKVKFLHADETRPQRPHGHEAQGGRRSRRTAGLLRPVPRAQVVDYWTRRQPEVVAARGRLMRAEGPDIDLLEHVWHRLEDQALLNREDLRESIEQMRRGEVVVLRP